MSSEGANIWPIESLDVSRAWIAITKYFELVFARFLLVEHCHWCTYMAVHKTKWSQLWLPCDHIAYWLWSTSLHLHCFQVPWPLTLLLNHSLNHWHLVPVTSVSHVSFLACLLATSFCNTLDYFRLLKERQQAAASIAPFLQISWYSVGWSDHNQEFRDQFRPIQKVSTPIFSNAQTHSYFLDMFRHVDFPTLLHNSVAAKETYLKGY